MSIATEPKRRCFKIAKAVSAFLFVLLLMYGGLKGRQQARLQARLADITHDRDQLQQHLDYEQGPTERLVRGVRGTNTLASRPPSNPQVKSLVSVLTTRLREFDADYAPDKLSEVESLEIRLSKATLANAEQRFADALTVITDKDEAGNRVNAADHIGRSVPVFQVRGDAFYGLGQWRDALGRYRQVLMLQSNRLATIGQVAACHYALGNRKEALTTYDQLAKSHNKRGDVFLMQGRPEAAVRHYEKAIEIQTWLLEQGRGELANDLARSHNQRGNAFLVQGQSASAIGHFDKAIGIQTRLMEQAGRRDLANELAVSHSNRGNAFLVQGKPGAAIGDYEKAIEIQARLIQQDGRNELAGDLATDQQNLANSLLAQGKLEAAHGRYEKAIELQVRLVGEEGRNEFVNELARSYNNRGVVRRAQERLSAASEDFENAIKMLTRLIEQPRRSPSAIPRTNRGADDSPQVKLDVAIGYADKGIELLPRIRVVEQGGRRELAVILAMSLKNRGYTHLVQRKLQPAVEDFKKTVEIFAGLVEQEGQRDLVIQFARSLTPLAWIYATNPDHSFRDGIKAKAYALKACELSEWKAFAPVEALAAACSETGNLADAVKWQEKAVELAPGNQKFELRSRLELYKSGKSYQVPHPKAE